MKEVPLTQGKVALVDDADYERVMQYKWHAHCSDKRRGVFYAIRNVGKRPHRSTQSMHAFLLGLIDGQEGDHRNSEGLDNRRWNLRVASSLQNGANKLKRRRGTSRFKGVHFSSGEQRWVASIGVRYKRVRLGGFEHEADAAQAYDTAAIKFFGEFANLNFPA